MFLRTRPASRHHLWNLGHSHIWNTLSENKYKCSCSYQKMSELIPSWPSRKYPLPFPSLMSEVLFNKLLWNPSLGFFMAILLGGTEATCSYLLCRSWYYHCISGSNHLLKLLHWLPGTIWELVGYSCESHGVFMRVVSI